MALLSTPPHGTFPAFSHSTSSGGGIGWPSSQRCPLGSRFGALCQGGALHRGPRGFTCPPEESFMLSFDLARSSPSLLEALLGFQLNVRKVEIGTRRLQMVHDPPPSSPDADSRSPRSTAYKNWLAKASVGSGLLDVSSTPLCSTVPATVAPVSSSGGRLESADFDMDDGLLPVVH